MEREAIRIICGDAIPLRGHWWSPRSKAGGIVVINPATGVAARYYHRYAAFLADHGFEVLTYDYRGIGLSRPERLSGSGFDWTQWGERDVEAALTFATNRSRRESVTVVGHSIGGVLPGYAASASAIDRMLTVGAQYAYWPDYKAGYRLGLFLKWHLAMPLLTALFGYFPGRRLGWLEDLPAGVAYEWGFRGKRLEAHLDPARRERLLSSFAAVTAPILAISTSDDPFATAEAVSRGLDYYSGAEPQKVMLEPQDLGQEQVGHFDLFHDRHAGGFWLDTLLWLRDGINPWPLKVYE